MENILINSPIVDQLNNLIGVILNAKNKYESSLYYGDIYINEQFQNKYSSFKIVKQVFSYIEKTNDKYHLTHITTFVEPINRNAENAEE